MRRYIFKSRGVLHSSPLPLSHRSLVLSSSLSSTRVSRESLALIVFRRFAIKETAGRPTVYTGDFEFYLAYPLHSPLSLSLSLVLSTASLLLALDTKDRGFPARLFSIELASFRNRLRIQVVSVSAEFARVLPRNDVNEMRK